jgi:NitT/TauT family transport system permease protein
MDTRTVGHSPPPPAQAAGGEALRVEELRFGASRWQVYRKLALPSSLPIMFAGIKTAATLALIGAIVGEFVGGDRGLGVLIDSFNNQLEIDDAFAAILALAIFGLALYGLVDLIDKKVVFWRRGS